MNYKILILTIFLLLHSLLSYGQSVAPVTGFARSFLNSKGLSEGKITVLETGQVFFTQADGSFGPIFHPIGMDITLIFEKVGYVTTQSATITVPKKGLVDAYTNISLQVPSSSAYFSMIKIMNAELVPGNCHVAATITALGKTMEHDIQGEEHAVAALLPPVPEHPFYFDIFTNWPLVNKTNPFNPTLATTSKDGGVMYFNLPARNSPYTLTAQKRGTIFSKVKFFCSPNMFVNLSPPYGPRVLGISDAQKTNLFFHIM